MPIIPIQMKIATALVVALALFAGGFQTATWRSEATISTMISDAAAAREESIAAILKKEAQHKLALNKLAIDFSRNEADAVVVDREVIKWRTKYVANPDIPRCDMEREWVQSHDFAARDSLPVAAFAAGGPDVAPRTFTDVDALIVVTDNYMQCRASMRRLVGLQAWAGSLAH